MNAELQIKSLIKEYKTAKDLDKFLSNYYIWKKNFSVGQRWNVYEYGVKFLLQIGEGELAYNEWVTLQKEEWGDNEQFTYRDQALLKITEFETKLNRGLVNSFHIHKIAFKGSQLTKFGLRNISEVFTVLDNHLKSKYSFSFFEDFWIDYGTSNCKFQKFDAHHYLNIFSNSHSKFEQLRSNLADEKNRSFYVRKDGTVKDCLVFEAIRFRASELLREAENLYRNFIGAKKVGESWISETELFYKICSSLPNLRIIQHGRPSWLGRQHLDIWIPELNIAIEYHGLQHDQPIDFFGGHEAYEKNIERDNRKKALCMENGVRLIEVREGYDLNELIREIFTH